MYICVGGQMMARKLWMETYAAPMIVERLGPLRGIVDTIVSECRDTPREDV